MREWPPKKPEWDLSLWWLSLSDGECGADAAGVNVFDRFEKKPGFLCDPAMDGALEDVAGEGGWT